MQTTIPITRILEELPNDASEHAVTLTGHLASLRSEGKIGDTLDTREFLTLSGVLIDALRIRFAALFYPMWEILACEEQSRSVLSGAGLYQMGEFTDEVAGNG